MKPKIHIFLAVVLFFFACEYPKIQGLQNKRTLDSLQLFNSIAFNDTSFALFAYIEFEPPLQTGLSKYNSAVLLLDKNFKTLKYKIFDLSFPDNIYAFKTSDSGLVLIIFKNKNSHILKLDKNFQLLWAKKYQYGIRNRMENFVETSDYYYFFGYNEYLERSLLIAKTNKNGELLKTFKIKADTAFLIRSLYKLDTNKVVALLKIHLPRVSDFDKSPDLYSIMLLELNDTVKILKNDTLKPDYEYSLFAKDSLFLLLYHNFRTVILRKLDKNLESISVDSIPFSALEAENVNLNFFSDLKVFFDGKNFWFAINDDYTETCRITLADDNLKIISAANIYNNYDLLEIANILPFGKNCFYLICTDNSYNGSIQLFKINTEQFFGKKE